MALSGKRSRARNAGAAVALWASGAAKAMARQDGGPRRREENNLSPASLEPAEFTEITEQKEGGREKTNAESSRLKG